MESNDSPEIPGRGGDIRHPRPPFGGVNTLGTKSQTYRHKDTDTNTDRQTDTQTHTRTHTHAHPHQLPTTTHTHQHHTTSQLKQLQKKVKGVEI